MLNGSTPVPGTSVSNESYYKATISKFRDAEEGKWRTPKRLLLLTDDMELVFATLHDAIWEIEMAGRGGRGEGGRLASEPLRQGFSGYSETHSG